MSKINANDREKQSEIAKLLQMVDKNPKLNDLIEEFDLKIISHDYEKKRTIPAE